MPAPVPGLIIAAPRSGGGKTTVTLGLLRALRNMGKRVQPFKCGPDYIDPAFHGAACGRASFNLDSWAMRQGTVAGLMAAHTADADLAVCEGVMGLFDGVATRGAWGTGASADIAAATGWPVVLVLDVSGQAQTAAAIATGCNATLRNSKLAGVILNRTGSERHRKLASDAIEAAGFKVFGALPRNDAITLPERHLGLIQAVETQELDDKLQSITNFLLNFINVFSLLESTGVNVVQRSVEAVAPMRLSKPPGQRIALASDAAFSFIYPHMLASWRAAGAEVLRYSPLANEAPDPAADAIWLPGGYPELYAGAIAGAPQFLSGLRQAAARGVPIHGECGGFMVLGEGLTDASGTRHAMAGLLGLETSYATRKLHLGYRQATLKADCAIGRRGEKLRGHEFHYSSVISLNDDPLAEIADAEDVLQTERGARRGSVSGSFFHMIDMCD